MQRRKFLQDAATMAVAAATPLRAAAAASLRIAVVGGGMGGCYAAHLLRQMLPDAKITLIEKSRQYCGDAFNNHVIAGVLPLSSILFSYDAVARRGIRVVHDEAVSVENKKIMLANNSTPIPFDYAVIAPGVGFDHTAMPGYSEAAMESAPHAFAGETQVRALQKQIQNLKDGDTVAILPPPSPARCTPAAYSRAGLIADYLSRHRPNSKILIFDSKNNFPLQPYFDDGWETHHRGRIEWFAADAGGAVERIDPDRKIIHTEFGEETAAVINYIPPQHAGTLAINSGLADDSGWCPVNPQTMESQKQNRVYVVGDAVAGNKMPKAGALAMAQAQLAAAAVTAAATDRPPPAQPLNYRCYSHITPTNAFWEDGTYRHANNTFRNTALTFSDRTATPATAATQAKAAHQWFRTTMSQLFATY